MSAGVEARHPRKNGVEGLLTTALRPALRRVGRDVYGAFLPTPDDAMDGADRFLEDLWNDAPPLVALGYTVATAAVWASPFLLLRSRGGIDRLSAADREALLDDLASSRFYVVRGVATATRAAALMAILRDPKARRAHLHEALVAQ